jgi:L-fucose mutarotase/ribose pyranase (RbsD/FucU family)
MASNEGPKKKNKYIKDNREARIKEEDVMYVQRGAKGERDGGRAVVSTGETYLIFYATFILRTGSILFH